MPFIKTKNKIKNIRVGIIGGAGYTAGELLRILLYHPNASIAFIQSSSHAGDPVASVHRDLFGDTELKFSAEPDFENCDVIFLCMGHGRSKTYVETNDIPSTVKIIDLSQDYRINYPGNKFTYGLPEMNRDLIKKARYIANPGCFATGIQLTLLPLAAAGKLTDDIHIFGITGSTGAGQNPSPSTHYSWRCNNISVYKAFTHQHLKEITQSMKQLQPSFDKKINFIPVRGNHPRGIFVSTYIKYDGTEEEAIKCFKDFYKGHPFVFVTKENPDLKQVVNTNKTLLHLEKHEENLLILSVTDNLLKGASGQAVQNMNLIFGLDEQAGLNLKPNAF